MTWDPRFAESDPRFAPIARAASAFAQELDWPPVEGWNERLDAHGLGVPVTFVPQRAPLRRGAGERAPYDREVARLGRVPSRERSLHDFLNMLVWAAFPRTKAAIHARQLEAAEKRERSNDASANRGRERDALSMIDEGGAIVAVRRGLLADLSESLAKRDAGRFAMLRGEGCTPLLLGHALYEHLVRERTDDVLAAALVVEVDVDRQDLVDTAARDRIADPSELCTPHHLARLPLAWMR